jgi:TPR repeat protein
MRTPAPLRWLLFALTAASAGTAGCSATGILTDFDPAADFATYRTYGFPEALATDEPTYTTLLSGYLKSAASRELEARGYRFSVSPDLLVDFDVLTAEKIAVQPTPFVTYAVRPWGVWPGYGSEGRKVTQYTEGTLIVDLVDRRRNQLVWEAALIGRLTEAIRDDPRPAVDAAVARVFREYPHRVGARAPEAPERTAALTQVRIRAAEGDADAQFLLGVWHHQGLGVPEDLDEAVAWYRRAAEQGQPEAQSNLGVMYLEGRGVTQDDAEALQWLRRAADQGVAQAEFSLGWMYLHGRGVPEDSAEAATWLERAAEQGLAAAQVDLGLLCLRGQGVPEDSARAATWFRRAAERGSPRAMSRLGMMYEHGRGVPRDTLVACMWYTLAASAGDPTASGQRERVAGTLSAEEIEQVGILARNWLEARGR